MDMMKQIAPWPDDLEDLVAKCRYRVHEGWSVHLDPDCKRDEDSQGNIIGRGLTLVVTTRGYDTYHPERGLNYGVHHYFIVPAATYNRASWKRWLLEQYAKVELHECMENFALLDTDGCPHCGAHADADGDHSCSCLKRDEDCRDHRHNVTLGGWTERPFAPLHSPGFDPYTVHQYATEEDRHRRYFDHSADENMPGLFDALTDERIGGAPPNSM